jgi:hypothetical protein
LEIYSKYFLVVIELQFEKVVVKAAPGAIDIGPFVLILIYQKEV